MFKSKSVAGRTYVVEYTHTQVFKTVCTDTSFVSWNIFVVSWLPSVEFLLENALGLKFRIGKRVTHLGVKLDGFEMDKESKIDEYHLKLPSQEPRGKEDRGRSGNSEYLRSLRHISKQKMREGRGTRAYQRETDSQNSLCLHNLVVEVPCLVPQFPDL